MELSDEEILLDYLSGNEKAFDQLVSRHIKSVYSLAYYITRSSTDAEDIVQETFVKLWKNIKKYKLGNNFKAWLLTIARNATYDHVRKRKHSLFSDFENEYGENNFVESLSATEPTAEELSITLEEKEVLKKAVVKLSSTYREVLQLRYGEEMSFEEIAQVVDRPMNTVKSQARRALIELRKIIKNI